MSYQVTKTNGGLLTTVPDTTLVQNYAGLLLLGKNYAGFGTALNNNLVYLAENFSDSTPPTNPLVGQLWYDSVNRAINVYNGINFSTLSINTPAPNPPSSANLGDEWFDTVNQQLNVWNGLNWILVGPTSQSGSGLNGIITASMTQNNITYYFADVYASNQLLAIVSSNNLATQAINGFGNIRPGINFALSSSSVANITTSGIYNAANVTIGSFDQLALSVASGVDGTITTTGNLAISTAGGAIYPSGNLSVSLGSPSNQFSTLYVGTIVGGSISANNYPTGANLSLQYNLIGGANSASFASAPIFVNASNIQIQSNLAVSGNIVITGNALVPTLSANIANVGSMQSTNVVVTDSATIGNLVVLPSSSTSVANIGAALLSNGVSFTPTQLVINTPVRTLGTYYSNNTNAPMHISVCYSLIGTNTATLQASMQYPAASQLVTLAANGLTSGVATVSFIILPGFSYYVNVINNSTGNLPIQTNWVEYSWQ